jgi:hypothetical protein
VRVKNRRKLIPEHCAFYAIISCEALRVLTRENPSELSTMLPTKS